MAEPKLLKNIEPIKFFSRFKDKRRTKLIMSLAKKYLDENKCYLRTGRIFHICGLAIIDQLITRNIEISDLKQICTRCPFKGDCKTTH